MALQMYMAKLAADDNLVYGQTSGKAVAFFMRLWEFKFPYDIDTGGIYHCETKRDALKVNLICQGFAQCDLSSGEGWVPKN